MREEEYLKRELTKSSAFISEWLYPNLDIKRSEMTVLLIIYKTRKFLEHVEEIICIFAP